jgi:uroporphyrinogen decarboxylase
MATPIREKWKGTMTPRERFDRQMHYKSVDRSFNMEFGYWDDNFTDWDIFSQNGIQNNEQANAFFNFDKIEIVCPNNWVCPEFTEEVISETETKKIIRNTDGLTAEIPKDRHDTIPHFIHSPVTTPEDWKKYKEERLQFNDSARVRPIDVLLKRHPEDRDYPVGVDCGSMIGRIRNLLTFEGLAYACYDYPDMVEDMVETICQLVLRSLDLLLPHMHFDYATGWEDICFKNGPIVSLDFFKNVITPRYKRIRKKLDEYGIDIWYTDCDGDVRHILPYLLEGGINCLFPYEVNSCAHPGELLTQYEGQLRIMGGFDKIQLGGGREAIKTYMKSLLPFVEKGGFIPFCDHLCPPNIDPNDYLYYLDLKESMFGIPK